MANQNAKKAAGYAAAELVQADMTIGLGTGSTAAFFIERLGVRCNEGLKVRAIATSQSSFDLGLKVGISMIDIDELTTLDMTVDGADEIDVQKRMIKGGGGALLREKIVASMSREMVVIVDSSKLVQRLGKFPLSVEIIPFAHRAIAHNLQELGYKGTFRTVKNRYFVTDNHNYIYDIHFSDLCREPEIDNEKIRSVPGVVETGFFFGLAGRIIVGFDDGHVEIRS